jgi:hypothetical protein
MVVLPLQKHNNLLFVILPLFSQISFEFINPEIKKGHVMLEV